MTALRRPPYTALAIAALAVALAGCAGGGRAPAASAVEAYLAALEADDPRAAYAMLAADVRRAQPYPVFAGRWAARRPERAEQAAALRERLRGAGDRDLGERAVVELEGGARVALVREAGRWHLVRGLDVGRRAPTPLDAVELFASALAARRWDDLVATLSRRRREGIAREVDDFGKSLAGQVATAGPRIELTAEDRAVLTWEDRGVLYRVDLRREDGEWRVDDVHARPAPVPAEAPASASP